MGTGEDKAKDGSGSTFSNLVKLVQALAWPSLVLLLFLFYRDPFSRTIEQIPDLVGHASEMKIGAVSFTIEQRARNSHDERLAEALKGLSPGARKLILEMGQSTLMMWNSTEAEGGTKLYSRLIRDDDALRELAERRLVDLRDLINTSEDGAKTFGDYEHLIASLHLRPASPGSDYMVSQPPLTADQDRALTTWTVTLNEVGKKAYSVILDVVTNS